MNQLQILTQFSQLFIDSKIAVDCYNNNVRNELVEKDPDDTFEQAYNKFEEIFDRQQQDIRNLKEVMDKQEGINAFFEICKQNYQILVNKNNKLIDKMIEMKKNIPNVTQEEFKECKEFCHSCNRMKESGLLEKYIGI